MAWNVHFGGDKLSAVDDATYANIKDALQRLAAQGGGTAIIGLSNSTETFELLWSPGAPIYFSYFDENADGTDLNTELASLVAAGE